jgi:hypothetical protein
MCLEFPCGMPAKAFPSQDFIAGWSRPTFRLCPGFEVTDSGHRAGEDHFHYRTRNETVRFYGSHKVNRMPC